MDLEIMLDLDKLTEKREIDGNEEERLGFIRWFNGLEESKVDKTNWVGEGNCNSMIAN